MNFQYKALIADDDAFILKICEAVLSGQGLMVQGVDTGRAALEALRNDTYDLILLDIGLPDMDGLAVLEHVTSHHAQISPIMMTGYATLEATVRAQELGAEGFILKPFNNNKLVQIVRRVIERRRLREDYTQLQASAHSEKLAALGRLVASLAHEINNPLQALRSGLRLLSRSNLDDAKRQNYVAMLVQEVERLIAITTQTLDFVRPSRAGKQPANLNQLLQDTLALVSKQLQQSQIEVKFNPIASLPTIQVVPDQIKQVFINLILNAIDAMPDGGVLSLAIEHLPNDDRFVAAVRDTGPGMGPEVINKIFEPFYSTKEAGTGLGLSVSYGIIEAHGGRIEVESTPGAGSCFTVYLSNEGDPVHEDGTI
jgi:signal transduction histidine kinase